jgi:hypothetical protein
MVGVTRVDPHAVVVAVDLARAAEPAEAGAAVVRHHQPRRQVVEAVRPGGIDPDVGVVERPLGRGLVLVDLLPALAAVVRAEQGALLGLDQGVDDVRVRARDGEADSPELSLGQAVLLREAPPALAAVVGDVEPGARAAGPEGPGPAPVVPHRGEELVRITRVDQQVGPAGPRIDVQRLAPGLPPVHRLEDPALGVLAPVLSQGRDPGHVRIGRVEHDFVDVLRLLEPQVGPGLASVERAVEAVADRDAVARVALARADPYDIRVGLVDGDSADRRDRLVIEDWRPGEAAVDGLPDAAGGRAGIHHVGIGLDDLDGGHAAAHRGRADRPRVEAGEEVRV